MFPDLVHLRILTNLGFLWQVMGSSSGSRVLCDEVGSMCLVRECRELRSLLAHSVWMRLLEEGKQQPGR